MIAPLILALFISLCAVYAIRKSIDVRFVLICAGAVMAAFAGNAWGVFEAFQKSIGKGEVIGPICSAMGYAFLLKKTGADREMILLLTKPLKNYRWLLVPGGCLIGYVTNMAITSQTASAAALGPILIPLMVSQKYSPLAAAATLLVGCSVGGNLFNPGEPDIVTIRSATGADIGSVIHATLIPNIIAFVVAVGTLSLLIFLKHRPTTLCATDGHTTAPDAQSRRPWLAILPPLPVLLLLLLQPGLNLIPALVTRWPNGLYVSTVMLVCSVLAIVFTVRGSEGVSKHISNLTTEFFDGMGYGFAKVISIIIAAACFIAGLESLHVIEATSAVLVDQPALAVIFAAVITWIIAVICGSGTAPSVSFSQAMLPGMAKTNLEGAVQMGANGAIGANIGRTMSPVSAILLFTSTLANVPIQDVVRLVAVPMIAALTSVILYNVFS